MTQPQPPVNPLHTFFTMHMDGGKSVPLTVEMDPNALKGYVLICLRDVNEVIEVFDIYGVPWLFPVAKITYVEFDRR